MSSAKALAEHLRYISRDSAMRDEEKGRVFDQQNTDVDLDSFASAAKDDRHHFRLIVSPEDGVEMSDMKPFVQDLVSDMETDLGTRLDWVAAVHDNTAYPHAHIVIRGKRDDGQDLVMPRAYISHGIRERAAKLVTLELGPETQLERDVKLARQTGSERVTEIDRSLSRMSNADGDLKLSNVPARYQAVNAARLRKLKSLGLAENIRGDRWRMTPGFVSTLKELGERRDIIKQIHKVLGTRTSRMIDPSRPFSGGAGQVPITGAILQSGLRGDGHDEPYLILDGMDGRAVTAKLKANSHLAELRPGMIVSVSAPQIEPRPADDTVYSIAQKNRGTYSAALHHEADPRSSPTYIAAHIRRLEKMRRAGLVSREANGNWNIPQTYLTDVQRYQERTSGREGASFNVESWSKLSEQIVADGLTWLDQLNPADPRAQGFAGDVKSALENRRNILLERGIISSKNQKLSPKTLDALKRTGLDGAGLRIEQEIGKPYKRPSQHGIIDGIYRKSITTTQGKFAVIDRQKTFTLVPWRPVMDRARGQAISGIVRANSISWTFGRGKGL